MVDIDNFKAVNDGNGHEVGDQVLKNVATTLQRCVRKNDIVARYGGEEFCIAAADVGTEKVERIAEKMRKKIEEACFENIYVTCSFGIASKNSSDDTPMNLISKADKALYYSKANGRNQVNTWKEMMPSDM
jgi:diguanylate cyclase (GGDEF)-like protein